MKEQHSDVQQTLQLALDYYFGYHLLINAYPDLKQRTKFAHDALITSASDMLLTDIEEKLRTATKYREALATVVSLYVVPIIYLIFPQACWAHQRLSWPCQNGGGSNPLWQVQGTTRLCRPCDAALLGAGLHLCS